MTQPLRVLIVEDEVLIAMSLERAFKRESYTICQHVASGEQAVSLVQHDPPDIVLIDIRLAGEIDGIEAARQIQAIADIPIIFTTGYPDQAIKERAEALNPLGYFLKPVRLSTLKSLIESIRPSEAKESQRRVH